MKHAPAVVALYGRTFTARRVWMILLGSAAVHEFLCAEGELLSEGCDRGLERHPVLLYGFTAITVAHILNRLPVKADPYQWAWLIYTSMKKGSL